MKDNLIALAKLAEMDDSARAYELELKTLPARLEEMKRDIGLLSQMLEREKTQLDDARQLRKTQQTEMELRTDSLAKAKSKAAKARNLKEADAVEREVESHRRSIKEREDEIAQLDGMITSKEAALTVRTDEFNEAKGIFDSESGEALARIKEVTALKDTALQGRELLVEQISKRSMKFYERARKLCSTAVVVLSEGVCTQCRMALPPQLFIEMQRGESLTTCPQCHVVTIFAGLVQTPADQAVAEATEAADSATA